MMPKVASEAEILENFRNIVAASLRIDPAKITSDANLTDLGAESLDLLEITIETEEQFDILMPEKDILQIATDVFGEGVLERDGVLTAEGTKFFLRRMPELEPAAVESGSLADLRHRFLRVDVWVRMIQGLMEARPKTCESCGGTLAKSSPGRLKCQGCGAEIDMPPGDALNRRWVQDYYETEYLPSHTSGRGV